MSIFNYDANEIRNIVTGKGWTAPTPEQDAQFKRSTSGEIFMFRIREDSELGGQWKKGGYAARVGKTPHFMLLTKRTKHAWFDTATQLFLFHEQAPRDHVFVQVLDSSAGLDYIVKSAKEARTGAKPPVFKCTNG